MSSKVEAGGAVAAAVALPAAVAYGAAWIAWNTGKLIVDINRGIDEEIAEKKRKKKEAALNRKAAAVSAHQNLVDMCSQVLLQMQEETEETVGSFSATEQMKRELEDICSEKLPEDTGTIENMTAAGFLKLDRIVRQQKRMAAIRMDSVGNGMYTGLSLADLMSDLRAAIGAMDIKEVKGADIVSDPKAAERKDLNIELERVTEEIDEARGHFNEISAEGIVSEADRRWFESCFYGVGELIERLRSTDIPNKELKKGIRRLEDVMKHYRKIMPSVEEKAAQIDALYKAYKEGARALGEEVSEKSEFKSIAEIREKLRYLKERAERAKRCAEIYKQLGEVGYMCYAWDCELKAMGYDVYTRKKITEMAGYRPEYAVSGGRKQPFYSWDGSSMTQLYSVSEQCSLQLIVHEDGTISMQTIADANNAEVLEAQRQHCEQLAELYRRLRENWFITYGETEDVSPEMITTVAQWRRSKDNAWSAPETVTGGKKEEGENEGEKEQEGARQI